jgi:hypothetical protein
MMKMMLHFFVIEVANNGNTKQVASVGICKRIGNILKTSAGALMLCLDFV